MKFFLMEQNKKMYKHMAKKWWGSYVRTFAFIQSKYTHKNYIITTFFLSGKWFSFSFILDAFTGIKPFSHGNQTVFRRETPRWEHLCLASVANGTMYTAMLFPGYAHRILCMYLQLHCQFFNMIQFTLNSSSHIRTIIAGHHVYTENKNLRVFGIKLN